MPTTEHWMVAVWLFLGLWTRLRGAEIPNEINWDEQYFARYAGYYLRGEFFHDVHPPLGKMIVAWIASLLNYDHDHPWGKIFQYSEKMDYAGLRRGVAVFGGLVVPMAYITARFGLKLSRIASVMVATMVLLDNMLIVTSRMILLDGIMLFFISLAVFGCCMQQNYRPFTAKWYVSMALSGLGIGLTVSTKWVGLFTVAFVGLNTLMDLGSTMQRRRILSVRYVSHWVVRVVLLIMVPVAIYVASFYIQFRVLNKTGSGDWILESYFLAGQEGYSLAKSPLELSYGSKIALRHQIPTSGFLHSHPYNYPEDASTQQQQVTIYVGRDSNNDWIIIPATLNASDTLEFVQQDDHIRFVRHGDLIRLIHLHTGAFLHAHNLQAYLRSDEYQVTAFGSWNTSDENDVWRVEVVDDVVHWQLLPDGMIRTLTTRFRLVHVKENCVLMSERRQLPDWSYGQMEVFCSRHDPAMTDERGLWVIDEQYHSKRPEAPPGTYERSYWRAIKHINRVNWQDNFSLGENSVCEVCSSPDKWPFMLHGHQMTSWSDTIIKVFMLGNPMVWWISTLSLIVSILLVVRSSLVPGERDKLDASSILAIRFVRYILLGWALHYFPFFLMRRTTMPHHYVPALYVSTFATGFVLDYAVGKRWISQGQHHVFAVVIMAIVASCFWFFRHMTYGMDFPGREYANRVWVDGWKKLAE